MHRFLFVLFAGALAAPSLAQAPAFFTFPANTFPTDVATDCGVVVVGTVGAQAFRWTPEDGLVPIGATPAVPNASSVVRCSDDGSVISCDAPGLDGKTRASLWTGGTGWSPLPDLGGQSDSGVSSTWGINSDGSMVVGLGWVLPSGGHGFSWTAATGTVDLGSTVPNRSSRANAVSGDGTLIVGWQDQPTGPRFGARWENGVQHLFTYVDAGQVSYPLGEAQVADFDGSIVAGNTVFGGDNSAWMWERTSGQTSLLANLPGLPSNYRAVPAGITDDGSVIVGSTGGPLFARRAIVWTNGQTQDLLPYLAALGVPGLGGYTSLGSAIGISRDGRVIVGYGASGGPAGGWIAILPETTPSTQGLVTCAGDGTSAACPCGNPGAAGRGCGNSAHAGGARLGSTGVASVTADTLQLLGSNMPAGNAIYLQSTAQAAAPLFDGVRCVSGTVVRLATVSNDLAGSSCYPRVGSSDLPISVRGAVPGAGGTLHYQVYYRDAVDGFCTSETANFSNAYTLTWAP